MPEAWSLIFGLVFKLPITNYKLPIELSGWFDAAAGVLVVEFQSALDDLAFVGWRRPLDAEERQRKPRQSMCQGLRRDSSLLGEILRSAHVSPQSLCIRLPQSHPSTKKTCAAAAICKPAATKLI